MQLDALSEQAPHEALQLAHVDVSSGDAISYCPVGQDETQSPPESGTPGRHDVHESLVPAHVAHDESQVCGGRHANEGG